MTHPGDESRVDQFDSWFEQILEDRPGSTLEEFCSALWMEAIRRSEKTECCETWCKEFFEQNPGIDTEGIAFALFVERMNNEMAENILKMRHAIEQRKLK